jgi:hypothetical protein
MAQANRQLAAKAKRATLERRAYMEAETAREETRELFNTKRRPVSAEETARLAADYLANHRVTKCPRATPKASTFYRDKARLVSAAYDRAGLISPRVKPGMVRH